MSLWEEPVTKLKGVGEARAKALHRIGLDTVGDVVRYFPRDYRDLSHLDRLCDKSQGDECVVLAKIGQAPQVNHVRRNFSVVNLGIHDGTGSAVCVWYNQPFLQNVFRPGSTWIFYGKIEARFGDKRLINPGYEGGGMEALPGVLPIYPVTEGISQKILRALVSEALGYIGPAQESLPPDFCRRHELVEFNYALQNIHFPLDMEAAEKAKQRLIFEEMLLFMLLLRDMKQMRRETQAGHAYACSKEAMQRFMSALPFAMTGAQNRVLGEILADMRSDAAMNRLVQGDVGCGKTALALAALYLCASEGRQGALMAPTEILAEQHCAEAKRLLEPLGMRVGLLKGSMKAAERREALEAIQTGTWDIVVGTHALIQPSVVYSDLGMVITDEQHRFGVEQRSGLLSKGSRVDMLVMSATPVPRTLALVMYGDLDVSVVDELPPGRKAVTTRIVPPEKQEDMYRFIRDLVMKQGQQAYVVCPLIEDSEKLDVVSAQTLFEELKHNAFEGLRMGLVHGRMKAAEKDECIELFRKGQLDVLVSTTVIEVGVNVPNASVMVLEGADRFGLAQLHQLRGRVGRGGQQAWCFLLTSKADQEIERLKVMCKSNDGFKIAEEDLKFRGPGELLGTRQSGMMDIHVLRLISDMRLVERCDRALREVFDQPEYAAEGKILRKEAWRRFAGRLDHIVLN